ncbi:MAG: hypothetical protein AB1656_24590 [Candidatus Omnitrophota bacterium]
MNEKELFRLALGLAAPWQVKSLEFSAEKNRPLGGKRILTPQEIAALTKAAYQSSYTSCGCYDPAVSPFCRRECSLFSINS